MYTGQQHLGVLRGVSALRAALGPQAVRVSIVSAGYGLLAESDLIVPYDVTFDGSHMSPAEVDSRATLLGIPDAVRAQVSTSDLVIFLLGARYLRAIRPPLLPSARQRHVFLAAAAESRRLRAPRTTVVPAGLPETRFGAGLVALKGRMFELFARHVRKVGNSVIDRVVFDDSPRTFLDAVEAENA